MTVVLNKWPLDVYAEFTVIMHSSIETTNHLPAIFSTMDKDAKSVQISENFGWEKFAKGLNKRSDCIVASFFPRIFSPLSNAVARCNL